MAALHRQKERMGWSVVWYGLWNFDGEEYRYRFVLHMPASFKGCGQGGSSRCAPKRGLQRASLSRSQVPAIHAVTSLEISNSVERAVEKCNGASVSCIETPINSS